MTLNQGGFDVDSVLCAQWVLSVNSGLLHAMVIIGLALNKDWFNADSSFFDNWVISDEALN